MHKTYIYTHFIFLFVSCSFLWSVNFIYLHMYIFQHLLPMICLPVVFRTQDQIMCTGWVMMTHFICRNVITFESPLVSWLTNQHMQLLTLTFILRSCVSSQKLSFIIYLKDTVFSEHIVENRLMKMLSLLSLLSYCHYDCLCLYLNV